MTENKSVNSGQTERLPELTLQFGALFDERKCVTFTVRAEGG